MCIEPMPRKRQFSLRTLVIIVTVLCVALSLAFDGNPLIKKTILVVVFVNALGFIAAQIVTHVFGLPRDGSYSFEEDHPDDEK
ncbi:hypothetical protein N9Y42_00565 [Mariniblastus sp.]|nr:hypothetical protein [Mariniblastus sp.]